MAEWEREALIKRLPGVSYLSVNRLPAADETALEDGASAAADRWITMIRTSRRGRITVSAPTLARHRLSGQRAHNHRAVSGRAPVAARDHARSRVVPPQRSRRVRATPRRLLSWCSAIGPALILIDNADRMFFVPPSYLSSPGVTQLESRLARMAARLRQWLERLPESLAAVITAENIERLPDEWRRLLKDDPHIDLDPLDPAVRRQLRHRVLAAIFRRHGLEELAGDARFLDDLSVTTLQDSVPCPDAVVCPEGALGRHEWELGSNGDIAHWIGSLLALHKGSLEAISSPDSLAWSRVPPPRPYIDRCYPLDPNLPCHKRHTKKQ